MKLISLVTGFVLELIAVLLVLQPAVRARLASSAHP